MERENDIIELILDNEIDDVLSQLDPEKDENKIKYIKNIIKIVSNWVNDKTEEVEELIKKFNGDIKNFAIKYRKDKNFPLSMNVIKENKKDAFEAVTGFLKWNTRKLEMARSFVKMKGF